jgi:hypothetical protein
VCVRCLGQRESTDQGGIIGMPGQLPQRTYFQCLYQEPVLPGDSHRLNGSRRFLPASAHMVLECWTWSQME